MRRAAQTLGKMSCELTQPCRAIQVRPAQTRPSAAMGTATSLTALEIWFLHRPSSFGQQGSRAKVREKAVVQAGKGPSTETGGADRACGLVVGDTDITATRILLHGHFRDNRDAHAGAHHAQDAAELAALKNDQRTEARAIAGGNRGIAKQ